jgi:LysR family glycine cleavage system transcriptional activator
MRRKLPSTAALAAFEAAARHQSYTRAASELAVTQSAICRQIASLEDFLGVKLFRRSQRGVALTEAGQRYSRRGCALDEVERDALDLMSGGEEGGGSLELAVVPTFATQWLLPRLGDFQRQHPGITLHFTPRTRPFLFTDTPFDAAILPGSEPWPGTESIDLLPEPLVAVASRACPARRPAARPRTWPGSLLQASTRPDGWRQWFASLGLAVEHDMAGPRMELFSMLSEAARPGLGVALVPRLLVESDLASGRLVVVLPHPHASGRSYRLIYPPHKADGPLLQALAGWLTGQAAAYQAQA